MHREYGVDLSDPSAGKRYTWRWFEVRLFGLSADSRTWRKLTGDRGKSEPETSIEDLDRELGITRE
ncbi:hypothetical protein [Kibdelosporangium phytohabitans]|uniref:hypothetical protein n=1 Tax=Kibdelosporangium phytohabitans TaxID=860235 RepID=UPI0015CFDD6B|nr:hypothetical protein [Kibdelosporangium phytohabitans]MBE1471367.1 hypothetical protein [Kibdelosporangium phytohabitans]